MDPITIRQRRFAAARMITLCALALAIASTVTVAHAQSHADGAQANAESDDIPAGDVMENDGTEDDVAPETESTESAADQPLDFSTPLPVPSRESLDPARFTRGLPGPAWTGKIGVDDRDVTPYADMPWVAMPAQNVGVAWANVTAPGLMAWDKTAIETRVDPYEQTRFGVTLSRSMPVGSDMSLTLQNAFAWTQPLLHGAPIVAHGSHVVEENHAVRFTILPMDTTFSIGAATSTLESGWRPSLSAEQRLFGGPVSITGTVSETATGTFDRSLKAGFSRRW